MATSTNALSTIIRKAIVNNFGFNMAPSFVIGIQPKRVICIFDDKMHRFPFTQSTKDFQTLAKELPLKEINDAYFDASYTGEVKDFF